VVICLSSATVSKASALESLVRGDDQTRKEFEELVGKKMHAEDAKRELTEFRKTAKGQAFFGGARATDKAVARFEMNLADGRIRKWIAGEGGLVVGISQRLAQLGMKLRITPEMIAKVQRIRDLMKRYGSKLAEKAKTAIGAWLNKYGGLASWIITGLAMWGSLRKLKECPNLETVAAALKDFGNLITPIWVPVGFGDAGALAVDFFNFLNTGIGAQQAATWYDKYADRVKTLSSTANRICLARPPTGDRENARRREEGCGPT